MPGWTFKTEFILQVVREIELGLKRPAQVSHEHNLGRRVYCCTGDGIVTLTLSDAAEYSQRTSSTTPF